jgi:hypothetical protein
MGLAGLQISNKAFRVGNTCQIRLGMHYIINNSCQLCCKAQFGRLFGGGRRSVRWVFFRKHLQGRTELSKVSALLDQRSLNGSAVTPGARDSRTSPGWMT